MTFYDVDDQEEYGVAVQPYTTKEMADMYLRSVKIWSNWVKPLKRRLGPKQGWFYNARQVRLLLEEFGPPPNPPAAKSSKGVR